MELEPMCLVISHQSRASNSQFNFKKHAAPRAQQSQQAIATQEQPELELGSCHGFCKYVLKFKDVVTLWAFGNA
ncbi:hypothetical protein GBA52_023332 [Prunus armeniaca]|nr:hypothetical protein GBA52_023332 [Prunus armeniaca]